MQYSIVDIEKFTSEFYDDYLQIYSDDDECATYQELKFNKYTKLFINGQFFCGVRVHIDYILPSLEQISLVDNEGLDIDLLTFVSLYL